MFSNKKYHLNLNKNEYDLIIHCLIDDYHVVAKPTFRFILNQCFVKNEPPFRSKLYQVA